jgi:hypothetical protein
MTSSFIEQLPFLKFSFTNIDLFYFRLMRVSWEVLDGWRKGKIRLDDFYRVIHSNITKDLLDRLSKACLKKGVNFRFRAILAAKPFINLDALNYLSKDNNKIIRSQVAKNPSTPKDLLADLSVDKSVAVRLGVAANKSTPTEILRRLSKDGNEYIAYGVAENPNTPSDVLYTFVKDKDMHYYLLRNSSTPINILIYIKMIAKKKIETSRWMSYNRYLIKLR